MTDVNLKKIKLLNGYIIHSLSVDRMQNIELLLLLLDSFTDFFFLQISLLGPLGCALCAHHHASVDGR